EPELAETKALANQAMRELLSLARQLRPTALDDLGLAAAIAGLVDRLGEGEIEATIEVDGDFSDLSDDAQLVVYRVAQEGRSKGAPPPPPPPLRRRPRRGGAAARARRGRPERRRRRPRLRLRRIRARPRHR